jgi:uncharacterized integral membrane protein (TIGR00698 family)
MNFFEKNLLGIPFKRSYQLLPGFLLVAIIAWLSIWVSEYIGVDVLGYPKSPISSVIVAIILGMLLNNHLPTPAWFKPGITFSIKKILRLGIILLGVRLSIYDVFKLGAQSLPIVLLTITSGVLLTTFLAKRIKIPRRLGTLIGVGTSICGASAIVATAPAIDAKEEEVTYAVAVITVFGIAATLLYPYLANVIFAGDPLRAGLFLGTAIHETAQVAGAGMVYSEVFSSPGALEAATVTKLVRNVFMAAVIPLMSYYYARSSKEFEGKKTRITKLLPIFILGFLAFAVIRSIGDAGINQSGTAYWAWGAETWGAITGTIKNWAGIFFVIALAGVGMNTNFKMIKGLGIKPFVVGLLAAGLVGMVSYLAITILM